MFNFWKNLYCFAFMPLYLGGGGGSSSSNTTTNNYSLQAGIGDGSLGIFGDGNTTNVSTTDFGAIGAAFDFGNSTVAGAFDFGKAAIDSNAKTYENFLGAGTDLFKTASNANSSDYGKLLSTTSGAFDSLISFGRDSIKGSLNSMGEAQKNVTALLDTAQSKGTMDNRTMMMLGGGVLLVAALFVFKSKG